MNPVSEKARHVGLAIAPGQPVPMSRLPADYTRNLRAYRWAIPRHATPGQNGLIGGCGDDMAYRAADDWLSQTIFNVEAVMKRHGFIEDFPKAAAVPPVTTDSAVIQRSGAIRRLISQPAQFLLQFSSWISKD